MFLWSIKLILWKIIECGNLLSCSLQLGVYVVSVVSSVAGDQLLPHLRHLLLLFSSTLEDTSSPAAFHTIQALTNFAPLVGQDNMVS